MSLVFPSIRPDLPGVSSLSLTQPQPQPQPKDSFYLDQPLLWSEDCGLDNVHSFELTSQDLDQLCPESQRILSQPNAGGQSIRSEGYAMEILSRFKQAQSVFTEMEIEYYYHNWKKSDFITTINHENVGVSVTRLLPRLNHLPEKYSNYPEYYEDYVSSLLYKKLFGLVVSRAGTLDKCAFTRSILIVWSPCRYLTQLIQGTFHYCTDPLLKDDVELLVLESEDRLLRSDFQTTTNIPITIPPPLSIYIPIVI